MPKSCQAVNAYLPNNSLEEEQEPDSNNGNQVEKAKSKQALYYDRGAKSFRMIPKKWTKTWAKAKVTLEVSPSRWSKVEAKQQTPM